jgi:hypothetical protein
LIYSKCVRGGCPILVFYDVDQQGREEFSEQELGDVRLLPFKPSTEELNIARHIRERAEQGGHELDFTSSSLHIMWYG